MSRSRSALGWLLLAGGVAVAAAPAVARSEANATFGSQWWTQNRDEAKFMEFREVPRGGFLQSFVVRDWSGRNAWSIYGTNAIRRDQMVDLAWNNGARWGVNVRYQQIPHNFSRIARSPYAEVAPGVLALPDTLQRTNQENPNAYTNIMTDLLASAPRVPLEFRTNLVRAQARVRPARGWQVEVTGTERKRSGNKAYGGAFGFNSAIEIWEPIDQRMLDGAVKASYHRDRYTVMVDAGVSVFDNNLSSLRWDNPKRLTDTTFATAYTGGNGSAAGQLALYPDNQVVRGTVGLAVQLPRRSALSATVGVSQSTQDQDLLPFTVNTRIPEAVSNPLPAKSPDAKATVLNGNYRLTSRAVKDLVATLRLQHYRYDNQTPELTFPGHVRLDQVWEPGPEDTHPFGNENLTAGVDLDFTPLSKVSVGGSYERRTREHTLREIEKDKENVFAARLRLLPLENVSVEARYRHGERELEDSTFTEEYTDDAGVLIEQPGLRRYDLADRRQDQARATVAWSPTDKLDLTGYYAFLRDDYFHTPLGLQEQEQHVVTAQATLHPTERVDLGGGYGLGINRTTQRSRESGASISTNPNVDWRAKLQDRDDFIFAQAGWQAWKDKLSLNGTYEFSRSFGEYELSNPAGTAQDLPSTLYRRHDVTVEAVYKWLANADLVARYGVEDFHVVDFASVNVPLLNPATSALGPANAVYLGDGVQTYRAHLVSGMVRYRF